MKILSNQIWRLIDWYTTIGLEGRSDHEKSKRYTFNVIILFGFWTAVFYGAFYALYDFEGLRVAWTTSLICMSVIVLPVVVRRSLRVATFVGVGLTIWVFTYLTYHLGADTGLYLFIIIGLVCVIIVNGNENLLDTLVLWVAGTSAMIVSALFFQEPSGVARVDPVLQSLVLFGVIVGLSVMIGIGLLVLSDRVARAERALAAEHARSEALLDNLLPTEIAARLKSAPGEVIADDLPEVTLLFADIVDFTPRATTMPPDEVVVFLNSVFTAFDKLTEQYGLEKIKTIGDAYMVAAGMPIARADHAQAIADMALAMLEATRKLSDDADQPIEVRIGLHSGSAIAGVIGTQKVFYDVWGDTVNTASRMESHGEIGRIQLTAETKERLGDAFLFEERGMVDIKGKGPVKTFWLTGKAG